MIRGRRKHTDGVAVACMDGVLDTPFTSADRGGTADTYILMVWYCSTDNPLGIFGGFIAGDQLDRLGLTKESYHVSDNYIGRQVQMH